MPKLALSLGLAFLLSAAATKADITIGEYGSLTGGTATFGISTDEGIKLAVDEINAKGWSARPANQNRGRR